MSRSQAGDGGGAPRRKRKGGPGGARPGAGRKPNIPGQPGVDHRPRPAIAPRYPVRITMKLCKGLPPLRAGREYAALLEAFAEGCERDLLGLFRLCHFAVLDHELVLICEAQDRAALARGLQGLMIRIAKALNRVWARRGSVFADRYDDRILRTPSEVRNALRDLYARGRQPAAMGGALSLEHALELFTSAPWFDGFREPLRVRDLESVDRPVAVPRTRLLREEWRRLGLFGAGDPAAAP